MHVTNLSKQGNISGSPESSKSRQLLDDGDDEPKDESGGLEDTLESHEVIELQAFIERKTWIEEKIQFLESLPPIDIFSGTGVSTSGGVEIPGLVTRIQLDVWVTEHDRIEKETEMFDSGDLKKLKKFTKAATERNLSPEDTDLIELTLTTLLALDRLLHLLRDRSENLELLGHRLDWEEHRLAAHLERRKIIDELQELMTTRLLWTPSTYEASESGTRLEHSLPPEANSSPAIDNTTPLRIISQTQRFKLGEQLTREVASLMSRTTGLRHNHVAISARILDQMIDNSRTPVPDEILDEQDRIEDSCVKELETVGKFAMSLVVQWKKADEIYVGTVKDKTEIRLLNERITSALRKHPVDSQDTIFQSSLEALKKRVGFRAHPIQISSFPRPVHVLFPQQSSHNTATINIISSELKVVQDLISRTSLLSANYHNACTIVQTASTLSDEIMATIKRFRDLSKQFMDRLSPHDNDDVDAWPPDLFDPFHLQLHYSPAFLATLAADLESISSSAQMLLTKGYAIASQLDQIAVESSFKDAFGEKLHLLQIALQSTSTSPQIHSPFAGNTSPPSSPVELPTNALTQNERLVLRMLRSFQSVSDGQTGRDADSQMEKEFSEMAVDRVTGITSRPSSSHGSVKDDGESVAPIRSKNRKRNGYSNLSVSSKNPPRPGFLSPPLPSRSISSSSTEDFSRISSSASSKRSVSGPIVPSPSIPLSRLYSSTFASRQRTTSTSTVSTPVRSRAISQIGRDGYSRASPTPSEVSVYSNHSISAASRGRSSRSSLNISRHRAESTPKLKPIRRKYVPNPQNQLDVAVGDVVNKLPVHINVEVVADTWKDQSGKYWIGDSEPKLCFCRILPSQTVMVRVGGGWIELSKFIKDHFADLFRLLPSDSSPRIGSKEEKWINSSSIKELSQTPVIPPLSPRTPEPKTPTPYIPAFALSTPEGSSLNPANTSPGSAALTPLQFIRRAEPSLSSILPTPLSKSAMRPRMSLTGTPRNSLSGWRP